MMRSLLFAAAVLAVGLPAVPVFAQSVPSCRGVEVVSPAIGAHFLGSRPIHFVWSGEPVGTVSRELRLAELDGTETIIPLDGRFSDTVNVKMKGDLGWIVVFYDKNGKALCTSSAGLISKGAGGGKVTGAGQSLSSSVASGSPVAVFMRDGRLVIVLRNSPYTGGYTMLVDADDYDGTNENLMGAAGLEIHGNDLPNVVTGSPKNDLIYLYGGNDWAEGGAGDDTLVGGEGDDDLYDVAPANIGDVDQLYGGPGTDYLNVVDGDALDKADWGAVAEPGDTTVQELGEDHSGPHVDQP